MKKSIHASVALLLSLFFFAACSLQEPDKTVTTLNAGDANFASYVALGNSITAGYQSGALTERHQQFSFPNLIAQQAGVSTFNQPLLGYPGIGTYTTSGAGIIELTSLFNSSGQVDPVLTPAPYASYPDFNPQFPYASAEIAGLMQPYNNLGVPGAVLPDLNVATSSSNAPSGSPFFDVILRNPNLGNTTAVQQAQLLQATFITLWIGNNDVLGYATSGGTFPTNPTDAGDFEDLYAALLDALLATNPQIVVATIPDVTAIPFFTTIPGVVVNPATNQPVLDQNGNVIPLVGVNPATDLVTLQAAASLAAGFGIPQSLGGNGQPLPDAVVLDADERATATNAVAAFNNSIKSLAATRNLAVVDINAIFNEIANNGLELSGQEFTAEFITGGLFSLDGVHPSDLGHAVAANEFIKVINEKYNATIPMVDIISFMDRVSPVSSMSKLSYRNVDPVVFKNAVKLSGGRPLQ